MAKINFRGQRVGGAGRPRTPQWRAAMLNWYYAPGGGGSQSPSYSQDLLYSMFLNQDVRPQVDTPPAFETLSSTSVKILGEDLIRAFAPGIATEMGGDGNMYFAAPGREDAGRDIMVYKYNPTTNIVEQFYRISHGLVSEDTHRTANMAIDANGFIYVVYEALHEAETHGSSIMVWKTTIPYDLQSLRQINVLTGRWSYPIVYVSGDDVFISARGSTSMITFIRGQQWYWNSSDGGETFGAPVKLYQADNENQPAYVFPVSNAGSGLALVLNERDNTLASWRFGAIFLGDFGSDVWTNAEGDFSKDVGSSGHITRTETRNNCMVVDAATDDNDVNVTGTFIEADGTIKMLVGMSTQTEEEIEGNPQIELDELRFYVFDEGWTFENVTIPDGMEFYWGYERAVLFSSGNPDKVGFINRSTDVVSIFSSSDNFATQTDTVLQAGSDKMTIRGAANNEILILAETPGDLFELTDEDALDYSDLTLIRI